MDKNKILLVISFFAIILESIVSIALLSRFQVKKKNCYYFEELLITDDCAEIRILRFKTPFPDLFPVLGRSVRNERLDNSSGFVRNAGYGESHKEIQKCLHYFPNTHAHNQVNLFYAGSSFQSFSYTTPEKI
jgi:hypothetical protein